MQETAKQEAGKKMQRRGNVSSLIQLLAMIPSQDKILNETIMSFDSFDTCYSKAMQLESTLLEEDPENNLIETITSTEDPFFTGLMHIHSDSFSNENQVVQDTSSTTQSSQVL